MDVVGNSVDVSISFRAMADGLELEAKVAADFTLWYRRGTSGAKTAINLSDLSAVTDAHSDGGLIHVDDGWYRLDVPDAAFAAGVDEVSFGGAVSGGVVVSAPIGITSPGKGARTVTVTVDDGSDPIEGATVRFTSGVTYTGETNASGQVVFCLNDATYTVVIGKSGYSFTPTTLVVDGDETPTYSMTAVTITPPPSADTITGVMSVYEETGVQGVAVQVSVQIIEGPGTDGIGYDSAVWTQTSSGGVVQFAGLIKGAKYKMWRGNSSRNYVTFTVPTTGSSFDLAEVIGEG